MTTSLTTTRSGIQEALFVAAMLAVPVLLGIGLYWWIAPGLIERTFEGQGPLERLNRFVQSRHASDPASYDLAYFQWMGRTAATRMAMLWAGVVLLLPAWRHRASLARVLRRFFTEPEPPLNLAVFRIAVCGTLLVFFDPETVRHHSTLPTALRFPPTGLGPVLAELPANARIADVTSTLLRVACVLGMLGLFTRVSLAVALLLALYALGIPQMYGKVNHNHHLIWFLALLAVSPCADALSLDAMFKRRRGWQPSMRSLRYSLPMRFVWLLFGVIYFFPGFWKLWMGGIDWIVGKHLTYQMYHLWSTHENWKPLFDPTGVPALVHLGALSVIVFEMCFIGLVFTRRTRLLALVIGLTFHQLSAAVLNISFGSLQWLYVAFVDWALVVAWIRGRISGLRTQPQAPAMPDRVPWGIVIMGLAVLLPSIAFGMAANNNGWPFACYPRFSYPIFKPQRSVIEIDLVGADGVVARDDLSQVRGRFRTARWVGLTRQVLLTEDEVLLAARLRALCELAFQSEEAPAKIRFYKASYSTVPADRSNKPLERELLHEYVPTPS